MFIIVACIVVYGDKILFLRRHPAKSQGGKWALPAGKIKLGETQRMAMLRELYEESGYKAKSAQVEFLGEYTFNDGLPGTYRINLYRLLIQKSFNVVLASQEHVAYRWVGTNEIYDMPDVIEDLLPMLAEHNYID